MEAPEGLMSQDCGASVRTGLIKASLGWTRPAFQRGMPTAHSPEGNRKKARKLPFSDVNHSAKDPKWEIRWGGQERDEETAQRERE